VGAFENLPPQSHTHLFVNKGGEPAGGWISLFNRRPVQRPQGFFTTPQLDWIDKLRNALALGTSRDRCAGLVGNIRVKVWIASWIGSVSKSVGASARCQERSCSGI